ncbi:NAD(P)/FAD-dependent oxidoreductase [Actinoplanes utahensis]|uniref:Oxidoreductase n=1 Tax=Actinoplanes utahensis TaxID=1869 RepID=A0A0A6X6E4_ACTUT|nr:FAD-dependent oxidoreductase [Actinoplanes utahensis]KHD75687.1 oxidoreductase [Actinoplanes utahensis]GIF34586.1 oxidoreductase [Actinoplanes utahensis]
MTHRIVVLGAGYAGTHAAGRLARRLHPSGAEITLVSAEPDFVQRVRLHQVAVGQPVRRRALRDVFAATHVSVRTEHVTAVDPNRHTVTLTSGELGYDTLVYALGSTATVTGEAHHVASEPAALRLRDRLRELPAGGTVQIVGGGLTGIEAATEIAEARPDLTVTIAVRGEYGDWLGAKAREHLHTVTARLGITVVAPGTTAADVTVWATGFGVHPIAADSGLTVAGGGRIVVDASMRSVSHPDVYAVGDAAIADGPGGRPLRMSCASGIPMAWQAADAIAARLTGGAVPKNTIRYFSQCISLGRRDGIIQLVTADDRALPTALTGRVAARFKEMVCAGAGWSIGHPTLMLPAVRRQVTAAAPVPR